MSKQKYPIIQCKTYDQPNTLFFTDSANDWARSKFVPNWREFATRAFVDHSKTFSFTSSASPFAFAWLVASE